MKCSKLSCCLRMGSKLYLACLIQHMLPKRQGGHPGEALIILELPRLITVD